MIGHIHTLLGSTLNPIDNYILAGAGTNRMVRSTNGTSGFVNIDVNNIMTSGFVARWCNNLFLIGGNAFGYSANGINIIESPQSKVLFTNNVYDFIYSQYGFYLAGGYGGSYSIAKSNDGKIWTGSNNDLNIYCLSFINVNGTIWCLGQGNTDTVLTTSDGINFIKRGKVSNTWSDQVCFGGDYHNGTIVIAGEGTRTLSWSSDGGVTWSGNKTIFSTRGRDVKYVPFLDRWIAVGYGTNNIAISTDSTGTSWTGLGNVVFAGGGNYVIPASDKVLITGIALAGGDNTVAWSINGTSWTGLGQTVFFNNGQKGTFNRLPGVATAVPMWNFLGDSITFQRKWTNPLAKLQQIYNTNYGVAGYTSAQLLTQLNSGTIPAKKSADEYIFVAIGTNDVRTNVSLSTYTSNIDAILAKLIQLGYNYQNIILPTIYYLSDYGSGNLSLLQSYNSMIIAKWSSLSMPIQPDVYTHMANNGGASLLSDGIHPTDAGGLVIANYYNSFF